MHNLETPAFIIKKEILDNSIHSLKLSLSKHFSNSILSYSLKTNSLPYILKNIKENDGYAEVVSSDEYELAKLVGFEIKNIVYNGPLKSKLTFLEAIRSRAIVNIETKQEIDWLSELPKDDVYSIGIRINIDLDILAPEDAKENEGYSRFGFSPENDELELALQKIAEYSNIKLTGLHAHRTTLSRAVKTYEEIARYIGKLTQKHSLELEYIDIGGGFYGIMEGKPTFDEYFTAIKNGLSLYFDLSQITVIIEPGNAVVASAIDFLSQVLDVKKIKDFYTITTDGSRNDLDPFYRKQNYFYSIDSDSNQLPSVPLQIISGGTCLEYDKIFEIKDSKLLQVGDKILYKSVGAYTMTLSPLFIRYFPNVYLLEADNSYSLIRKKWSAADFFTIYNTTK